MKRDLDLIRNILMEIEKQYDGTAIHNLQIDGYNQNIIANHCRLLYEKKLISDYKPFYADNKLYSFGVSDMTYEGYNLLNNIKDEKKWKKIRKIMLNNNKEKSIDNLIKYATFSKILLSILSTFFKII